MTRKITKHLSVWTAHCWNRKEKLRWAEKNLKNILHPDGELYLLSAAFATQLDGYGSAPANLYVGIDNREIIEINDTLAKATSHEPKVSSYKRQILSTSKDFALVQNERKLKAEVTFEAGHDIMGISKYFITTSSSGSRSGKLLISVAMKHERTLFTGDILRLEITVGLKDNKSGE